MAVNDLQKAQIKNKAIQYLEKSIYTLSYVLSVDPEAALGATSVDELISSSLASLPLSPGATASFQSLFNQVSSLKLLG
jgi:hypothetical protein